MVSSRKLGLYIFTFFLVFFVSLSIYFFVEKPKRVRVKEDVLDKKEVILREAFYLGERKGKVDLKLKAEVLKKSLERNEIELEKIEGSYFSEGKEIVSFSGKKGLVNVERKFGTVSDLKAKTEKGYELETSSVRIDLDSLFAKGKEHVRVVGKNLSMEGIGIEGDLKEGKFKITKDVKGFLEVDGERYEFSAGSFTYEPRESSYVLDLGVRAKGKDLSITCRKMKVLFHSGEIDRLEAYGKAEIRTPDTLAKSESAVYHLKDRLLLLTGSASVKKEDVEVKGEIIEYDLKGSKLQSFRPKVRLKVN